ncbi:glycosyltransferase family 4 protein [uncultured Aquimarina sp.]|uniref:glycosyltransferase family 4 protein n=1 Tax=uncultured Aquimarina sp. TaxID=575652 RepID=UPI00261A933C|nr:glycosyltransferase family 4 protein [uncultured Aquimarina sp.]
MKKKKIIRVVTSDVSYGLLTGQLKFLSQYYDVVGVSSPGEKAIKAGQSEGIRVVDIEMQRQISIIKDCVALYKLYKFFRKENPYIVHSITPKAGLLSMIASYLAKVPNRVHTFTGLIFPTKEGLFQKLLIKTDQLLCKCATHIYPEGQGVKNDLKKYKITKKPLKIIANGNVNGIDIDYFNSALYSEKEKEELKRELSISSLDLVYVFVGRLVRDKGINELISAFKRINDEYENVKLILVGSYEKELDPVLPETEEEINNNPNIIPVGWQTDVRPYFAISNVLTFPSYREGFPNVVLQAGAMELSSIVTDINGCNEIISEGKNGMIIPVKNIDFLYGAMEKFIKQPELKETLAMNARKIVCDNYERQFVWDSILEEYKQL